MVAVAINNVKVLVDEYESILNQLDRTYEDMRSAEIDALAMVDSRRMRSMFAKSQEITEAAASKYLPLKVLIEDLRSICEDIEQTNNFVVGLVSCAKGVNYEESCM